MASGGKKKTTMAKLQRESRLRERRVEKAARKRARKDAAHLASQAESAPNDDPFVDETQTDDREASEISEAGPEVQAPQTDRSTRQPESPLPAQG